MIPALWTVAILLVIVIAQLTGIRGDIQKLYSGPQIAPMPTPTPTESQVPLVHEILNHAGEVIDTVPHEHGITDAIKLALRTPGMAVRWAHSGVVENGRK